MSAWRIMARRRRPHFSILLFPSFLARPLFLSLKPCTGSRNRVFSLTWPAYMQIYCNKRKRLHKKRVQLPGDWFGTPTWPPFYCFGTPIWPARRHVKTLYRALRLSLSASEIIWIMNKIGRASKSMITKLDDKNFCFRLIIKLISKIWV